MYHPRIKIKLKLIKIINWTFTSNNLLLSRSITKRNNGEPDVVPTNCDTLVTCWIVNDWLKTVVEALLKKTSNPSGTPP